MKNKKSKYTGHFIFEYNSLDILSFVVITFVALYYGIAKYGFHPEGIIVELASSLVIYLIFEIVATFTYKKTIKDYPEIATQIDNLIDHIKHKIKRTDNLGELRQDLNNLSNSIHLSIDSNGLPIKFDPDSDATNKLFNVNNLIAISEAEPYNWLDPTYIFYLINNSIINLNWAKDNVAKKTPINFAADRFDASDKIGLNKYEEFVFKRKSFVEELSKIDPNNSDSRNQIFNKLDRTVRFIFLSDEDKILNKCTIEYLYTIHEMFGCFLYLINIDLYKVYFKLKDKNIIEENMLSLVVESTNYDKVANNNKVDIGFGINNDNQFEVIQRSKQILESKLLNDVVKIQLANYLQTLAAFLLNNYDDPRYLYNNCFKNSNSELIPNTKNYFIYFND